MGISGGDVSKVRQSIYLSLIFTVKTEDRHACSDKRMRQLALPHSPINIFFCYCKRMVAPFETRPPAVTRISDKPPPVNCGGIITLT